MDDSDNSKVEGEGNDSGDKSESDSDASMVVSRPEYTNVSAALKVMQYIIDNNDSQGEGKVENLPNKGSAKDIMGSQFNPESAEVNEHAMSSISKILIKVKFAIEKGLFCNRNELPGT